MVMTTHEEKMLRYASRVAAAPHRRELEICRNECSVLCLRLRLSGQPVSSGWMTAAFLFNYEQCFRMRYLLYRLQPGRRHSLVLS